MHHTAHLKLNVIIFLDNRFRMNGNNNNPSIYEVEMSEDSDDNWKRTTETHDDFSLASPLGWITEVLIRLIMGAILLISYIVVDPFIRYVERKKS